MLCGNEYRHSFGDSLGTDMSILEAIASKLVSVRTLLKPILGYARFYPHDYRQPYINER